MIGSPAQIEDWESDILRTQDQENEQCLLQKYNNIRFLDDEDNQTYVIASEYLKFKGPPEGIGSILWLVIPSIVDLVQLKTSTFSTRALILVHFKNVNYFSQLIFSLFSHLNIALHNLVIQLCSALKIFQRYITVI